MNPSTRQSLHRMIDSLPERELQAAARYLQFLHLAPGTEENEVFTEEEMAAMQESWSQMERGEVVSFEEVVQGLDPGFSLGA